MKALKPASPKHSIEVEPNPELKHELGINNFLFLANFVKNPPAKLKIFQGNKLKLKGFRFQLNYNLHKSNIKIYCCKNLTLQGDRIKML